MTQLGLDVLKESLLFYVLFYSLINLNICFPYGIILNVNGIKTFYLKMNYGLVMRLPSAVLYVFLSIQIILWQNII